MNDSSESLPYFIKTLNNKYDTACSTGYRVEKEPRSMHCAPLPDRTPYIRGGTVNFGAVLVRFWCGFGPMLSLVYGL